MPPTKNFVTNNCLVELNPRMVFTFCQVIIAEKQLQWKDLGGEKMIISLEKTIFSGEKMIISSEKRLFLWRK